MTTTTWGRYAVKTTPIGVGYQGQIYKGYDKITHKRIAIKKVTKLKYAHRELMILKNHGTHPCIPKLYGYFTRRNQGHIVMEFIKGVSLLELKKELQEKEVVRIIIAVLEGFEHLHQKGYLHCDVAPQNIMIDDKKLSNVKIIDFANSVQKGKKGLYQGKKYKKKNPYGPPELREKKWELNDSTDLYGVAATCVYLLNKHEPQYSEKHKTHMFSIDNEGLMRILQKAMHPDKKKRYSSAREMINALQPFA